MANRKMIPIKGNNLLAKRLKAETPVRHSDGWRGRILHDDGEYVTMVREGGAMNPAFNGYRGFWRRSIKMGGQPIVSRSQVIDMHARKFIGVSVTVLDRAKLEAEWDVAIAREF